MSEARFNRQVIARGHRAERVEGNHNVPLHDVDQHYLCPSDTSTTCPWKGQPGYDTVEIDGIQAPDVAWTYPNPLPAARQITRQAAACRGVVVAAAVS